MQNPMHVEREQEEACLKGVLEAVEDVERCAEALRTAEEAANLHDDHNAGDVDRINREVGERLLSFPAYQIHSIVT